MKYHTLFFLKIRKNVAKFVVCFSRDWRFKSYLLWNKAPGQLIVLPVVRPPMLAFPRFDLKAK